MSSSLSLRNSVNYGDLDKTAQFGHSMLKHFQFENGYVNVNHGSYGSTPKCVADFRLSWLRHLEMCPDRVLRNEVMLDLRESIGHVATLMNVKDVECLAFVQSASSGINAVLRSLKLDPSDEVLYLSEAYGAVKKTVHYAADFRGAKWVELKVDYPFEDQDLVDMVEGELKKGKVKAATFSHISSVPTAIFPVKKLTQLCRRHGVLALIDGAHVLGQIPLDIEDLDPDFYVTNGHKWLFTGRSSAVLYAKPELRDMLHSTIISWNYQTTFQNEFHQLGTLDYSNFLTFPVAIEFRRRLGGETRIRDYTHNLCMKAAKVLVDLWKTDMPVPEDQLSSMANIRLPVNDSAKVQAAVEEVLAKNRTYLCCFEEKGVWYARISAQIFNELSDYEFVGKAFLEALKD